MDGDARFTRSIEDLARDLAREEAPDWEPRIPAQPYRPYRRRRWRGL